MDAGATMEAKPPPRNLGGSLPVPNVQDLAARIVSSTAGDDALDRYLRDDARAPSLVNDEEKDATCWVVPVVDLGRLLCNDPEVVDEEATKLRSACEEWGFFHVVNHGVPAKVIAEMEESLKGFFQLPLAEKLAFAQQPGGIEGYGQAFVVSEKQKLDYSDMYFLATQPPEYRSHKFWPPSSMTLRDSLERYSIEVQRVAIELLRMMAKNLGVDDPNKLTRLVALQSVRMNYYPTCPESHADRVLGLSPHSDAVGLTLLLQVGQVPGLQIKRQGRWIPVVPKPGAFVANIGDVIEVVTNGMYKSVEHRAVVSAHGERMSAAAFHTARFGDTFGPMEEMTAGDSQPPRYRTISVEDYVRLILSSKLDGKNTLDAMKIKP